MKSIASRYRRHFRLRAKIIGSAAKPRCSVFRSNRGFQIQLIDDTVGRTLLALNSRNLAKEVAGKKPMEVAAIAGEKLAGEAIAKGIKTIVFDRGGYRYHGRVKALAEGLRKGGLSF